MADYNSMKVPELKKLLTERGLPHTGNKADLIARLTENDKQQAAEPQAEIAPKPAAEDEIDYEDDDVPAAPAAAAGETKATSDAAPAEPQPAATTTSTTTEEKPAETTDKPTATTTTTMTEEPAKPTFTQNLPPTDAKTEAEKRAARAARFGVTTTSETNKEEGEKAGTTTEESEAAKKAARAARFGLPADTVSALDSALPDRRPKRGRGAGGEEDGEGQRGGKRRNQGQGQQQQRGQGQGQQQRGGRNQSQGQGRGRHGGGRNVQRGGGGGGGGGGKPQQQSKPAVDPAEKAKMEARAKRFATAA